MLIGYARVSTTDQDLTLQIEALTKAGCERLFTDKASGAKAVRPGLTEALHFARAGDTLVIWKLDRLGRSIRGLIELEAGLSARDVDFRSLTDGFDTSTPSGRLLFHILASVAEMERELVKERTIAGLAAARARGGTGGGRKPAMTPDKIDTARKLLAAGDSPAKIAKLLQVGLSTFYRYCPGGEPPAGYPELTWYDFAYSPVRGDAGEVVGLLNVTSESTTRVRAQQERDSATTDLSANEAKWRRLFETLEEGFILGEVVRDETGRIVDWRYDEVNDAWYDLVGVERGCAIGRTIREVFPGIEDEWVMEFARVVETGEAIRFTRQVGNLDRWYDGVCQPAGGDCFTVLFLEVTDRIRSDRRREALAELGRALPAITDPDGVVHAATAIIGRTLGVGRVGYGTVGEDGETFIVPSDWTAEGYPSLAGTYRMDDYGGYAEDLRQGNTVVIPDIRLDPRTSTDTAPLEAVAVRSLVNRPIVEKGRTVAVLYVNDDQPRDWTPEELAFIADAGNRTRTALERRRAEEEARETAAFMKSVLAASTDCIKVVELDGTLSFMSEGGMKVMEISDFNAVRGCPWPSLLREDGPAYAREAIEAAKRGETTHFEAPADTYIGTPKHWSISVSPIPGPDGEVARILSVSRDHTELHRTREQQQLLNGELAHRIKNTMSVVQAIAHQTLGKAEDQEAVAAFGKRLGALAAANDVLTRDNWSSAKLGDVARGALSTFGEDRFTIAGPDVMIGSRATLALTLMLHELATNAAKYGALTAPEGKVAVSWAVRRDGDKDALDLSWVERGGPPAIEPTRKGFGSRIIRMGLSGSGGVKVLYETEGLTMRATAPLYQIQEA